MTFRLLFVVGWLLSPCEREHMSTIKDFTAWMVVLVFSVGLNTPVSMQITQIEVVMPGLCVALMRRDLPRLDLGRGLGATVEKR